MATEGYKHAGDIEVESARLVLSSGKIYDISNLISEVNIYQDLFKHYLEAEFVMDDSLGLFNAGSSGNEVVEISYRNSVGPGVNAPYIRNIFNVYEISDKQRISEFREIYIMNCISAENYLTSPIKISRSFGPSLISDMIKKISDEFLYNNAAKSFYREMSTVFDYVKNKTLEADSTQGQQQLIIPNMPVDDAIDFLSSEADSSDHIPYYTFYEDSAGFKFKNISNLVSQTPILKFYHLPVATDVSNNNDTTLSEFDDTYKIISYNVIKQTNILENANRGLFKHKTINLDIHRRKKKETIYDYDEYGDKFKKIENKILGGTNGDPIVTLTTTRKGHDSDITLRGESHYPKKINETLPITRGYQRHVFNFVMELTVPGNDKINVGNVIEIMFYQTVDNQVRTDVYDKYLSGNYLITKVRQKITGAQNGDPFVTIIECTRDGIREN